MTALEPELQARLDRAARLHTCLLCEWSSWRDESPDDLSAFSYGDLHPIKRAPLPGDFLVPDLCMSGDYSGSSIDVANLRSFQQTFPEVGWEVYGGHGTSGLALRLDQLTDEQLDWLEALEDYPVADEEEMARVEMEWADEAWDRWAESDLRRELGKAFNLDFEGHLPRDWFEALRERANAEWYCEGMGTGVVCKLERVAEECTLEDLASLYPSCPFTWGDDDADTMLQAFIAGDGAALDALHDYLIQQGIL